MGEFLGLVTVEALEVDAGFLEQLVNQQARAGTALAIDENHPWTAQVGKIADALGIALGEEQTLGAGNEVNQFLLRQQPFCILGERPLSQFALRHMEAAEFAGAPRNGSQRFLGAQITQVELDLGMRLKQFRQLGHRETMAGVDAQGGAGLGDQLADLQVELGGQAFQLRGEAGVDALLRPEQFFSQGRQGRASAALKIDQGTAEKL